MKLVKLTLSLVMFLVFPCLIYAQQTVPPQTNVVIATDTQLLSYPINVFSVLDSKCMGCHKPDARNEKARTKHQWVVMQSLEKDSLITVLNNLNGILEEGSMPPARMLERFPERALTEEETALLKSWVQASLGKLE